MKYLLTLLFFSCWGYCGIMDHVKPALNKSHDHCMDGIDFIYMINLDQRPEKYAASMGQLTPFGISPYRFSAVNGWEDLTVEDINELGVCYAVGMDGGFLATKYPRDQGEVEKGILEKMNSFGDVYFCGCMTRGQIGCHLSHVSVLKDAYDSGYKTIWVMEDDIEVLLDPSLVSQRIRELDELVGHDGWDILFTDRDHRNPQGKYVPASGYARRPNYKPSNPKRLQYNYNIGGDFRRIGARFGTHSMIIRRSGIKKLIDFFENYQMYHPIDMDIHAPEGMRLFTVLNDIVGNELERVSDVGMPSYKLKQ